MGSSKKRQEFAGRKWTAWFCRRTSFNDGPYKFKGLPGLIVKISDETNSHSMELREPLNLRKQKKKVFAQNTTTGNGTVTKTVILGDGFWKNAKRRNRNQQRKI